MSVRRDLRYLQKVLKFCDFGRSVAELSCCKRLSVGAVVFDSECSRVLSLGYNGPPAGVPDTDCTGAEGDCGCAHAEANAMVKLDPSSVRPSGAILFCTHQPCVQCSNAIINSGAVRLLIWENEYRDRRGMERLSNTTTPYQVQYGDLVKEIAYLRELLSKHPNDPDPIHGGYSSTAAQLLLFRRLSKKD